MSGLANPRGLFFDTDGTLFVAEAGVGGGANGVPFTGGGGSGTFGLSGSVSSRRGLEAQTRPLVRLPSIAAESGAEAAGPGDIGRTADGRLAVLFGLGAGATARDGLGAAGAMMGTLSYYDQTTSTWTLAQDFAAREQATNPDPVEINSNPFGMVRDGAGFAVADGGANVLWRDGGSTLLPSQQVPNPFGPGMLTQETVATSVVAAPGGGFLVGELGGFPFAPGSSRIHAVGADGSYLGAQKFGLSSIIDMAYAPDGSLLVLELASDGLLVGGAGDVIRIQPNGYVDTLITGLVTPTSLAFGNDGRLYVTNDALSPTGGQVLRYGYAPVPEPASLAALGLGAVALLRRRRHKSV